MQSPLGLSDPFQALLNKVQNGEELYQTVITLPVNDIVEIFESAADDFSWIEQQGDAFMKGMFSYLNVQILRHALGEEMMMKVAKAIRRNNSYLKKYIIEDVNFVIKGETITGSSLLFRAFGGEYFSDLIDNYLVNRKKAQIPLEGISRKNFNYIKEFIYTDTMETLWKEEPRVIIALQKRADHWKLKEVSEYAFNVYKNYISRDVLLKRLIFAFSERNMLLTEELIKIFQQESLGFKLSLLSTQWFELQLETLNAEILEILEPFLPFVSVLIILKGDIDEEVLKQFLQKCNKIEEIHLSQLKKVLDPVALMLSIPKALRTINLQDLSWVNDKVIETIADYFYNIRVINFTGCENYQPKTLSTLNALKELEFLSVSGNPIISAEDVRIICASLKTIRCLDFSNCAGMNDTALQTMASKLVEIQYLNLSSCKRITQTGILSLSGLLTLRTLIIKDIPNVPKSFKEKYTRKFWMVQNFII